VLPRFPIARRRDAARSGTARGSRTPDGPQSSTAKARTGKVPIPATIGGAALNRKPSCGSASSPRRCSTIGMPAASSVLCAGRAPSAVSSMLSESMPTSAAPCSASQAAASAVRYGWPVPYAVGAEVPVPAGVDEHRPPGDVVRQQRGPVDRPGRGPGHPDHHAVEVGHPGEREGGEVGAVAVPVERAVEVGARVPHHRDPVDGELGARRVVGARLLPGQVHADLGARQPRVGDHAVPDGMAQVDHPPCGPVAPLVAVTHTAMIGTPPPGHNRPVTGAYGGAARPSGKGKAAPGGYGGKPPGAASSVFRRGPGTPAPALRRGTRALG